MQRNCEHEEAIVNLLLNLFNLSPTSTVTHTRYKRGWLDGFFVAFSTYNFFQIRQLSSSVDQLKQNQRHIVTAIKHLTTVAGNIANNVVALYDTVKTLGSHLAALEFETKILTNGWYMETLSHNMLRQLERSSDGIYKDFGGHLSPKLTDPSALQGAIDHLEVRS